MASATSSSLAFTSSYKAAPAPTAFNPLSLHAALPISGASVTFSSSQTLPVGNAADIYTNTVSVSTAHVDPPLTPPPRSAPSAGIDNNVIPTGMVTKIADRTAITQRGDATPRVQCAHTL